MVEYSLMLVLIGALALIFLTGMGVNVSSILQQIGTKLDFVQKVIGEKDTAPIR